MIVSKTTLLVVRRNFMTFTNCEGATSIAILAILADAIAL